MAWVYGNVRHLGFVPAAVQQDVSVAEFVGVSFGCQPAAERSRPGRLAKIGDCRVRRRLAKIGDCRVRPNCSEIVSSWAIATDRTRATPASSGAVVVSDGGQFGTDACAGNPRQYQRVEPPNKRRQT
jgi:hypothetical protein